MRLHRAALAAIVLAVLPATAEAGPIEFSFTTASWIDPLQPGPSPGPLNISLDSGGNLALAPGDPPYVLGGVVFGPSPGPQGMESTGGYLTGQSFHVAVTVTDAASGQSGTLNVGGAAQDGWAYRAWDGQWVQTDHYLSIWDGIIGQPYSTSEVIGGNRYTLTVAPDPNEVDTGAIFSLSAAAATPEPGTLLLAATALAAACGCAARNRLRRRPGALG
jgi:hypothetical protein